MTVMDAEQGRKLKLMRDSMAHRQRAGCEAEGFCEASTTGRIRRLASCAAYADKRLKNHPVLLDVKKVADMGVSRATLKFRYHVQDAMYREGAQQTTGDPHGFFFRQ